MFWDRFVHGLHVLEEFDKYMFLFVWCKVNRCEVRSGAQRRQELEGGELDCVSPTFCQ